MKNQFAHAVSFLLNPGCLFLGTILAGVIAAPFSRRAMLAWVVTLLIASILSLGILFVAWARGVVLDADLATPINLRERSQLLVIFLSILLLMLIVTFRMGQPQPMHAILVTIVVLGLIVACITLSWKISLHMLGVATLVSAVLLIGGLSWWPISFLLPMVAWARLQLGRHTPLQLLAGTLLGFLVTSSIFWAYKII